MFNFVVIVLAVMVGILMANVVATLVVYNTRVMRWIGKKALAMSEEFAEEYLEADENDPGRV